MRSSDARLQNEALIIRSLVLQGESNRQRIEADTGLSKATVSRLIRQMVDNGRVTEREIVNESPLGRSTQTLGFRGSDHLVCGIDIGGTTTRIVLTDHRARLVSAWRTPTSRIDTADGLADWVADQVHQECSHRQCELPTVTVVGIPGVVEPDGGPIRHSPNLPAIEGDGFLHRLRDRLTGICVTENDSNLALVGEVCAGAAAGADVAVMMTVGTGLGAGVTLQGRLLTGPTGMVGEIGMLPIDIDGTVLEAVISGTGIVAQAAELGVRHLTPQAILGDDASPSLSGIKRRVTDALFTCLVAFVVAYEPAVIVVGGGVSPSLVGVLPELQKRLRALLDNAPEVRLSRLGDPAGAIGAVAIALGAAYRQLGADVQVGEDKEFCRSIGLLADRLSHLPERPLLPPDPG